MRNRAVDSQPHATVPGLSEPIGVLAAKAAGRLRGLPTDGLRILSCCYWLRRKTLAFCCGRYLA